MVKCDGSRAGSHLIRLNTWTEKTSWNVTWCCTWRDAHVAGKIIHLSSARKRRQGRGAVRETIDSSGAMRRRGSWWVIYVRKLSAHLGISIGEGISVGTSAEGVRALLPPLPASESPTNHWVNLIVVVAVVDYVHMFSFHFTLLSSLTIADLLSSLFRGSTHTSLPSWGRDHGSVPWWTWRVYNGGSRHACACMYV